MINTVDSAAPPPVAPRARRRWRLWTLVASALIVVATAVALTAVALHYIRAAGLESNGIGWLDSTKVRYVEAAGYTQLTVDARPAERQSFYVEISNPSSVTQTILGLPGDPENTRDHPELSVSQTPTSGTTVTAERAVYDDVPVAIPPGASRYLRYTFLNRDCMLRGQTDYWRAIDIRVRVGVFTRTETIDFGRNAMAVVGTDATCSGAP